LGDIISLYNPSISLGLDIIGDGLDIPFFNGIWKGDFESNQFHLHKFHPQSRETYTGVV